MKPRDDWHGAPENGDGDAFEMAEAQAHIDLRRPGWIQRAKASGRLVNTTGMGFLRRSARRLAMRHFYTGNTSYVVMRDTLSGDVVRLPFA